MKTIRLLPAATLILCKTAFATDYIVDFTRVSDFETMRPLITGCKDLSAMELYRDRLEKTTNLEDMRNVFIRSGLGMFNECPADISGPGIALVE